MNKRLTILALVVAFLGVTASPAQAWFAARGYHGAVAVGGNRCCYHNSCCYSGGRWRARRSPAWR
jgi:hypothetical protein